MSDFASDYPVVMLRGCSRPTPAEVRRSLRRRMIFLEASIATRLLDGKPIFRDKDELKAVSIALDVYNSVYEDEDEVVPAAAESSAEIPVISASDRGDAQ